MTLAAWRGVWARTHRDRRVLLAACLALVGLEIVTVAIAGHVNVLALIAVLVSAAVMATHHQDPFATFAVIITCVLLWTLGGVAPASWWSLPAGVEIILIFLTRTLTTLGPAAAPIPRPLRLLWARRSAVVVVVTVVVAVLAIVLNGQAQPIGSLWPAALLLVVTVLLGILPMLMRTPTTATTTDGVAPD